MGTCDNIIQTALEVIKEAIRNIVVTNPGVAYPLRGPLLGRCLTGQFLRNLAIPNVDDSSDIERESQINHSLSPKILIGFVSKGRWWSKITRYAVRRKDKWTWITLSTNASEICNQN